MAELRPDFSNWLSLDECLAEHSSAGDALRVGDYEAALILADRAGEADVRAAAQIMCGALRRGLEALGEVSDELKLYADFARWCLREDDTNRRSTHVLLVCDRNSAPDVHAATAGTISYSTFLVDGNDGRTQIERPDLVISLIPPDEEVQERLIALGVPLVAFVQDYDLGFASKFDWLCKVDLVICNSTHEHAELSALVGGRIASCPAHGPHHDWAVGRDALVAEAGTKDYDVYMSGGLFMPHMMEKARFVFRLASLDDPTLAIMLKDGRLPAEQYCRGLARARLSPALTRCSGLLQTRAVDAVRHGSRALHPAEVPTDLLLGPARTAFAPFEETNFEEDVLRRLAEPLPGPQERADLESLIPLSPVREIRLIKFALFQLGVLPRLEPAVPVSPANALDRACAQTRRSLDAYLAQPLDTSMHRVTAAAFDAVCTQYPFSLALAFNRACFEWIAGERAAACFHFRRVVGLASDGAFEPRRHPLPSHRVRVLQDIVPFQVYTQAMTADARDGDPDMSRTRQTIAATAMTFLALDRLQSTDLNGGIVLLRAAQAACPKHAPALRLLAKALGAAGAAPSELRDVFYDAVNLYPPHLTQLLPLGADAERALGNEKGAFDLVRKWAWFFTRTTWRELEPEMVPPETFAEVRRYLDRFPEPLAIALRSKAGSAVT